MDSFAEAHTSGIRKDAHRVLVAAVELGLHLAQLRQQHLAEGARHDLRRQARDVRRDAVAHQQVSQLIAALNTLDQQELKPSDAVV